MLRDHFLFHWVHADNLGLIGLDETELRAKLADVVSHFNRKGLVMHETESGRAEMGILGCSLDCVNHKT